ncbi:probable ATP-dependent RNA helicase DDX20 isoform X2 [Octopus sinensis]|uniref:RNA helicase n=1 Tax=Octopus sinensis TaxID=2607531 RepID=A0A7E6ETB9_9MOLL|nr:probable ATP-dependent RNA helicase DDX20 isoform X2 [Octopus sinensis]
MLPRKVAHNVGNSAVFRTSDIAITEDVTFEGLLLSDDVLKGLQNSGFVKPSPIQLKSIPLGRCGLDLIVQAKAGTGKTCVFTVVALEALQINSPAIQVLVLAPTREIAFQIWQVITSIGSCVTGLKCATFIGGLSVTDDKNNLKICHIAVGTPGRIKFLIEKGYLRTKSIRLFVLDEADQLLDEQFQADINWIYSVLPENKQMLALSATYPEYLAKHLMHYMRNPTYIRLNTSHLALLGIKQYYLKIPYHPLVQKVAEYSAKAAIKILSSVVFNQCLVFSNLQSGAQSLAVQLEEQGWPTCCIAGSLDQKERNEAMASLKSFQCRVLVSTDLTSRGIDAENVNLVINLDLPKNPRVYLHRIGRAGRYGSYGAAITLVAGDVGMKCLKKVESVCNTSLKPLPDPIPHELISEKSSSPNVSLDDLVLSETIPTKQDRNCNNLDTESSLTSVKNFSENNPVKYSNHSDKLNNHPVIPSPEIEMKSNSDQELQHYFSDQNSGYVHLETSTGTALFEAEKTGNKDIKTKETRERSIKHNNQCDDKMSIELSESSEVSEGNNNASEEAKIEIFKVCEKQDSSNVSDGLSLDTLNDTESHEQKPEPKIASANDVLFHEQTHYDIVKSTGDQDECHSHRDLTAVIPTESNEVHQQELSHVAKATITAVDSHIEKPDTCATSTENIDELLVEEHISDVSCIRATNGTHHVLSVDADNNHHQASMSQKSTSSCLNNQVDGLWPWGTIPQYKKSKEVGEYSELCKKFKSFQINDNEPKCENIESLMPTTAPLCLESVPNVSSILNKFYRQSSAKLLNEIYDNQPISSSKQQNQNNVNNKDNISEPKMLSADGEEASSVVLPVNAVTNVQCAEENLSKDDCITDDAKTLVNKGERQRYNLVFEKTNTSSKLQVSLKRDEVSGELSPNDSVSKIKTENHKTPRNAGSLRSKPIDVPQKFVPVKNKSNNLKFGSVHVQPDRLKEDFSLSEDSDSSTTSNISSSYSEEDDFSESSSSSEYSFSDSLSSISSDVSEPCHKTSAGHNPSFPWQSLTGYPLFYPSYPYHYTWANWMPQACQSVSQRPPVLPVPNPFHSPPTIPPASLTRQQFAHSYFQQYNYIQWMVRNSVLQNK